MSSRLFIVDSFFDVAGLANAHFCRGTRLPLYELAEALPRHGRQLAMESPRVPGAINDGAGQARNDPAHKPTRKPVEPRSRQHERQHGHANAFTEWHYLLPDELLPEGIQLVMQIDLHRADVRAGAA